MTKRTTVPSGSPICLTKEARKDNLRDTYMKKSIYINTFMIGLFLLIFGVAAFAQTAPAPTETPAAPDAKKPADMRTVVLGQLGLTRDQIQRIRRINVERKPLMDEAQKRLKEANRALDEAIYSDQVSDTDIQAKLKEAQLAQGEVARIRFMNEFAVRRILTPEQLIRFRDLRAKFEEAKEAAVKNRPVSEQNPGGRIPVRVIKQQFKPALRPNQPRP